jgi:hypothetical protein
MESLDEKKEQVVMQFRLSYDLDTAMIKVDLTDDEKKLLLADESFMFRIRYQEASLKEDIVSTMVENLNNSSDPKLSQKAAIDLGNIMWKEKFKGKGEDETKGQVPDSIVMVGA